ncbi:tenascin-R-like, partial [Nothobranchius furzeri]
DLVDVGYQNWKKAKMKDSGFCSHARSESHVNAMFAWTENKKTMDKNASLFAIMDEENKKQLTENQYYIKTLAEILVLTATENVAQRSHRETSDSEKKGIFLSMLDLLSNHNPSFPKTFQGGARRSFHSDWYKSHPWLEYSQLNNSAYCFACRHFSLPDAPRTVFTSLEGYQNWKKAKMKDSGFCSHARSESHVNAMFAWTENKKTMDKNASLFAIMDEENKKQLTENQYYIKTLAEILVLTATENVAQRSHRETSDSEKKGIFLSMLDLLSNHNPVIKKRLEQQAKNAKYTSKTIQNEILECLAGMVKKEIIQEVKKSKQFSVIVDETRDVQKKEQISFVLRYYYSGVVHESFLEFEVAEQMDAAALSDKIINFLEKHGLEYKDNLVGQGYDGAAVMRGAHAGVQAKIKEVAKHAFYVHCSAHCLNLVIVDAVKSVADAGNFFSLLERMYTFISGSYVHNRWLEVQREMFDGAPRELQQLSDTRWACRHIACRNVMDRQNYSVQVMTPSTSAFQQTVDHLSSGDKVLLSVTAVANETLLGDTVTTVSYTTPLRVFNLMLTSNDSSIRASWNYTKNITNSNGYFRTELQLVGSPTYQQMKHTTDKCITFTGLQTAANYTVTVYAVSGNLTSPPVFDFKLTLPKPPTNAMVRSTSTNSITFAWTPPDNVADNVVYKVFIQSGFWNYSKNDLVSNQNNYTFAALKSGTNYSFSVLIVTATDTSERAECTGRTDSVKTVVSLSLLCSSSTALHCDDPKTRAGVLAKLREHLGHWLGQDISWSLEQSTSPNT